MIRCHCGLPLHYASPESQAMAERVIATAGGHQYIPVTVSGRTWLVQRHYVMLHGLKAQDLLATGLGFEEIKAIER